MKRCRVAAAVAALLVAGPLAAAASAADPPIDISSSGVAYTGSSADPVVISTLTRNDAGDLFAFYNTGTDGLSDVKVRMLRSADDGATWTAPVDFAVPSAPGRRVSAGSATRLSDGTLLVPYNDQLIVNAYLDRQNDIYVARSTDGGTTWSGRSTPITIGPSGWYMAFQFGQIVELDDGTLLMPIWGAPDPPASTSYATLNPEPLLAGVVRSTDHGRTWGSFSAFQTDPFAAMRNLGSGIAGGTNETTIVPLRDGRLLAMVRYDTLDYQRQGYRSWSDDGGVTWSPLVRSGVEARGPALFAARCSASLPGDRTKLLYATAVGSSLQLTTSYDDGVTFRNARNAQLPTGTSSPIYADAEYLDDGRLFVLFTGASNKLMYNVIEESDAAECQAELTADTAATAAETTIQLHRADADGWSWRYARNRKAYPPSTPLSTVRADAAGLLASYGAVELYKDGRALPASGTLASAGVVNGDLLTVAAAPASSGLRVGFTDQDTRPLTRRAGNFDDAMGFRAALDTQNRSLVVERPLAAGEQLSSLSIRDSDGANGVTAANTALYTSPDGRTWTRRSGISFSSSVTGGRKTITFSGIASSDPYAKVKFTNAGAGNTYTLVVQSREDVTVTVTP